MGERGKEEEEETMKMMMMAMMKKASSWAGEEIQNGCHLNSNPAGQNLYSRDKGVRSKGAREDAQKIVTRTEIPLRGRAPPCHVQGPGF